MVLQAEAAACALPPGCCDALFSWEPSPPAAVKSVPPSHSSFAGLDEPYYQQEEKATYLSIALVQGLQSFHAAAGIHCLSQQALRRAPCLEYETVDIPPGVPGQAERGGNSTSSSRSIWTWLFLFTLEL